MSLHRLTVGKFNVRKAIKAAILDWPDMTRVTCRPAEKHTALYCRTGHFLIISDDQDTWLVTRVVRPGKALFVVSNW